MFARVGHAGARLLNAASYCIYVEPSSRDVICKPVGERPQKDQGKDRAQFWENRPNSNLRAARGWTREALHLGAGTRDAGGSRVGCHVSRQHLPFFGACVVMPQPQEWNPRPQGGAATAAPSPSALRRGPAFRAGPQLPQGHARGRGQIGEEGLGLLGGA